ncbi:MAG: tetratricopeptide repeat protein [Phormidesmis sp.]
MARASRHIPQTQQRDDYTQVNDCYHQLTLAQEISDRVGELIALGNLGVVAYEQDNYAEALVLMTRQLEIAREIGDRTREAQALGNLRNVHNAISVK